MTTLDFVLVGLAAIGFLNALALVGCAVWLLRDSYQAHHPKPVYVPEQWGDDVAGVEWPWGERHYGGLR